MRITITKAGSRGDVQPYVALGLGLEEAGHEVTLAAPATFEGLVRERGLRFYPISLDPLEAVRRQLEKDDANLFEFAWRTRGILAPIMREDLRAYLQASREAEAIIYTPVGFLGYRIAAELGVPNVGATCGPLLNPTHAYPCSFVPVPSGRLEVLSRSVTSESLGERLRKSMRGAYNRLSYPPSQQLLWQFLRGPVNETLRESGLSPFPLRGPFEELSRGRGAGPQRLEPTRPAPPAGLGLPARGHRLLVCGSARGLASISGARRLHRGGPAPGERRLRQHDGRRGRGADRYGSTRAPARGMSRVLVSGFGGFSNADLPDELFKVEEVHHD